MYRTNRFKDWGQLFRKPLDPYHRFNSIAELRRAADSGSRIDVNQATVDDWLRLPGLSIHQARSLVLLRQSGVLFYSLEDIAAALGMPLQRLQPLAPILQFCYYDPEGLARIQPLDPNQASLSQWMQIPGVDASLAEQIQQERQQHGSYRSLIDLQQRLQLPAAITTQLMHYLRFG
jgi:DNA uptake protein ComE-like DNA-binding protein